MDLIGLALFKLVLQMFDDKTVVVKPGKIFFNKTFFNKFIQETFVLQQK
jgi:hypothetical protein